MPLMPEHVASFRHFTGSSAANAQLSNTLQGLILGMTCVNLVSSQRRNGSILLLSFVSPGAQEWLAAQRGPVQINLAP